jgi:RNA polymerase sigma-70 factor (ECF subfamily)
VALEDYMHVDLLDEMQLDEDEKETWMNSLPSLLETLEQKDLELIELRFFESKSFKEAGEILDITENNAKTKTYRILARIKKEVKNFT